jgi:cytochrome c peroxidase
MGRFKAPTLRNIEKTAPYIHDGSIATLEEVIDHYAAGGRMIAGGPHAGVGSHNPFKSSFIVSFTISEDDRAALVAFLRSLTDEELLTNPKLAAPWTD